MIASRNRGRGAGRRKREEMGMAMQAVLLLFFLGSVVVKPRTYAVRAAIAWVCGTLAVVLVVLIVRGVVPWN
jgi:hypothetical protein